MAIYTTSFTVSGLNQNNYLINNPIFVDLEEIPSNIQYVRLTLTVTGFTSPGDPTPTPFTAKLRPYDGSLYFDLSRYIKGMMPTPQHPYPIGVGEGIPKNQILIQIDIALVNSDLAIVDQRTYIKRFIRGGKIGRKFNQTVSGGTVLKESTKIPNWAGFPNAKYTINGNGLIIYTPILSSIEIEHQKVVGCNPCYIRFLNSLGGYSFWLFDSFDLNLKTDKPTVIERRDRIRSTGNEAEWEITVQGRVERKYWGLIRSLAESPEVAIYNLGGILSDNIGNAFSASNAIFTDVINPGQKVETDSFGSVQEIVMTFELRLTHNREVRW